MTFEVQHTNFGGYVIGKLHTQRKPQRYHVSPTSDNRIMVQSDKSIGLFDFRTGEGILNIKGCYFPDLSKFRGAINYTFPSEFVSACLEASPSMDSETDTGMGFTIVNTVEMF